MRYVQICFLKSLFLVMAWSGAVSATPLLPLDQAVFFEQVDFRGGFVNSTTGEVTIDIQKAVTATGHNSGYVNISDNSGNWVVRNLPILDGSVYDHPTITTSFNLGTSNGNNVSSMSAFVDYSSSPVTSFPGGPTTAFSVTDTVFAAGGFEFTSDGYLNAPNPSVLQFQLGGLFDLVYQPGHKNVQCANNQCAPMAMANSLQWHEDNKGLKVPHDHKKGLKGDDSLVGQLDTTTDRGVRTRADGDPLGATPILEGKLEYIANNNLGSRLITKHQGLLGNANFNAHGLTSIGKGLIIDPSFIIDELLKGEDIELGYLGLNGGHFVEVTGAGHILGIPWISYVSDHQQTDADPMDTLGTDKVDFSFLFGTTLVNEKGTPNAAFLMSQSVPEPDTLFLFVGGLLSFMVMARKKRNTSKRT